MRLKKIAFRYPNIYKVILFGSRERGDFRDHSDIDLAIFSKMATSLEIAKFRDDIENLNILVKIDLVFITSTIDEKLLSNIKAEGLVIMERLLHKVGNFKKAVERLDEALIELRSSHSSVVRDGVIQRFEFTTELAWKAVREYLVDQGFVEANSPKSVMKEAFNYGLVQKNDVWIQILNDRNLTSHLYQEELAIEICARIAATHFYALKDLSVRLQN